MSRRKESLQGNDSAMNDPNMNYGMESGHYTNQNLGNSKYNAWKNEQNIYKEAANNPNFGNENDGQAWNT